MSLLLTFLFLTVTQVNHEILIAFSKIAGQSRKKFLLQELLTIII